MSAKSVHWSEGMFLRPQHFQASDRYWAQQLATSATWDSHYNYGLKRIQLSTEALANHQVEISACSARLRDGTLIDFEPGEDPDRVDFKQDTSALRTVLAEVVESAFDQAPTVRVYLAIPRMKLGRANVCLQGPPGTHRFTESKVEVADESAGGRDQQIGFRDLNVQVLLSTQDLSGYEALPIAQIKRSADDSGTPILDEDYIPPVLDLDAWSPLQREFTRATYDFLGQRLDEIRQEVVQRNIRLATRDPSEAELLFRLMQLNEIYGALRILVFTDGVHPLLAYTELVRVVGKLAIFRDDRRIPDPPLYDHDDLGKIFRWVKQEIWRAFEDANRDRYEQEFFVGYGRGMHVNIKPKWLVDEWEWFVGVNRGSLSGEECRELLQPGFLNWKMGSAGRIDEIWDRGALGLQLVDDQQPPSILPTGGWIYYRVNRESPSFRDVQAEQSLAMRFAENYIQNLNDLQGKQDLRIKIAGGKQVTLQFALFALQRASRL